MPTAVIDGLEVYYETKGSGSPLLMFAPGGFDATIDKWIGASAWKEINALDALAAEHAIADPESFGVRLARHFLDRNPKLHRVRVDLSEHPWGRIPIGAREHGQAFVHHGAECRTASVQAGRDRMLIGAGVRELVILKSSRSEFRDFLRDELTTLPDASDRLLATALTANWHYGATDIDFNVAWRAVRSTMPICS